MSIIRRNNLSPSMPMTSLFDDLFSRDLLSWGLNNNSATNPTIPAVNFEVELAAPGMRKEDFKVELDGNQLTISSERRVEEYTGEHRYTKREFSYQSFQRTFQLAKDVVDADKIEARYEH